MTFTLAGPTEAELLDWVRANVPDLWSEYAVDTLLATYDFAEKGSASRNNRHKIGHALISSDADSLDIVPFSTPNPEQATANLTAQFHITYKPATALVDLPMPVVVQRHQCPFCRRYTRKDPAAVTRHMGSCWANPGLRCCKTCAHHQQVDAESDEACTEPDGPEFDEYSFPVLNCPLWQARKEA